MKYVIEIPENSPDYISVIDDILRIPIYGKGENHISGHFVTGLKITPYTEPDRKAIEDEVWNFVKTCVGLRTTEFWELFETDVVDGLFDMSYQEAKAKYEAWKKKEEAICVGDEVKHKQYEWTGFVTNISESGYLTLMWGLGEASKGFDPENFEKTGKHCKEVEELIKKISEAQHNEEE